MIAAEMHVMATFLVGQKFHAVQRKASQLVSQPCQFSCLVARSWNVHISVQLNGAKSDEVSSQV